MTRILLIMSFLVSLLFLPLKVKTITGKGVGEHRKGYLDVSKYPRENSSKRDNILPEVP